MLPLPSKYFYGVPAKEILAEVKTPQEYGIPPIELSDDSKEGILKRLTPLMV
jgi:hypothetical protein